MFSILRSMKADLKRLAATIREKKQEHSYVHPERVEFRHKHFVYCLLRGRTPEQIENKNRPDNERQQYLIERYWLQYVGRAFPVRPDDHEVSLCTSECTEAAPGGTEQ